LLFATVTRVHLMHGRIAFVFSPEGLRATVPIVAFWTVSGLRSTFLAPADQRGRWIFRVILGKAGPEDIGAAKRWVFLWSALLSLAAAACACVFGGLEAHRWLFAATQIVVGVGWSLILTDLFFLNVTAIPFTGVKSNSATNFALLLIPYLGFFPAVVMFTVALEPIIEASVGHLAVAVGLVSAAHLVLRAMQRSRMAEHVCSIDADDDEEEFPLRLGLRY
jgi:FlaA1/EpsC-like NDP-sugar epimerase